MKKSLLNINRLDTRGELGEVVPQQEHLRPCVREPLQGIQVEDTRYTKQAFRQKFVPGSRALLAASVHLRYAWVA